MGVSMTRTMCALWLAASVVIPGTLTHALSAMGEQTGPPPGQFVQTNDKQLREWAIASPAPEYPRASLSNRVTGVVVAAVLFSEKGATDAVDIVQSPDAETGRAVRDAVMRWKIRPIALAARATLVFYFHLKGRDGVVLSPAEMRLVTNPDAKSVKREDEPPAKHITDAEFRALSTRSGTLLLDIRDRETFGEGHENGAVNIPLMELLPRGPAELPVSRHIVIDCRDPPDFCAVAVHFLASSGFGQVSILRR
jgi:TonB family protein